MDIKIERLEADQLDPSLDRFKVTTFKPGRTDDGKDVMVEHSSEVITLQNLLTDKAILEARIAEIDTKISEIGKLPIIEAEEIVP